MTGREKKKEKKESQDVTIKEQTGPDKTREDKNTNQYKPIQKTQEKTIKYKTRYDETYKKKKDKTRKYKTLQDRKR